MKLCFLSPASRIVALVATVVLTSLSVSQAATIPGLYNSGVSDSNVTLANGTIDPHWRLVQRADTAAVDPNVFVVTDTLFPIVAGPWLASSATSKWIGPMANQSAGSAAGDYRYRLSFSLAGLEPSTATITVRISSDNATSEVLLNGVTTGLSYDGNFGALSSPLTINSGFIDGTNTLDFVVNNAGTTANPTAFRVEFVSGTADTQPPPGTPPTVNTPPASVTVGLLDPATFTVRASGSRPFDYQWRFNGTPIPNATNISHTVAAASEANVGSYDVVISNSGGTATSAAATLAVTVLSPAQRTYEPLGASTRRTGLTFSELMYHPADRVDGRRAEFIEIYNSNPYFENIGGWRLTGSVDYTFPSNTLIQGNSFLVVAPVPADVEAIHGISGVLGGFTNALPNEGGTLRLRKRSGGIVLELNYDDQPPWPVAADGSGHSLVLARPSYGENNPRAWAASATRGGSPGAPDPVPTGLQENVVINEILAHTDLPLVDYIEIFNNSGLAVDISGCWLTDSPDTNKFRIPDGTMLPARGFLVFDETQLGFLLEANGETVFLVSSNQSRVLDALRFDGQANGVAYGRFPDGTPALQELQALTPGTTNAPPLTRAIVITEIMYNPLSGENDDEFVELHNDGEAAVALGGWRFISGIDYTFPAGTTLGAGSYLVVAKNASRLTTNYPGLNSANLIGDYGGSLANSGERLALAMPDFGFTTNGTEIITNRFFIVVDEVTYVDGGRWGRWADGGGSSLELRDAHSDNRAGANWVDSDDTAKSAWTTVEFTGLLDNGSGVADRVQVMLLGAGEALVDDVEVIVAGQNRVPNSTFEGGSTGWIFGGTHSKTSLENTGFNSSRSLHLRASDRGDQTANRLSATLTSGVASGSTATLRAKVKWLRGHPEILIRLKGNYIEAFGRLPVPGNLGTPGAANSSAAQNLGPVITDVSHRPVLPQAGQAIRVTARVADPDRVQSVTLRYRLDPTTTLLPVTMTDDGANGDQVEGDGVYTGQIPAQNSGTLVAFRIEAADLHAQSASTQFPANAPVGECLVRVGESHPGGTFGTYRLWLTASNVNTWASREKSSNENLDGTFVYGTNRVIYNAGGHYSGSPYTSPGYSSPVGALCGYDISFPEDDPFLSTTHIVMDWPVRDDTNQREQLMYWFLEQYSLPNNYRRYVHMFVNGVRRGTIMDDVQQPTGETVEQWFSDDPDGALFKPDCWDEFSDIGDRETGCIDLNSMELFTTTGGVKKTARYRWVWKPRAIDGTANDYLPIFNLVDAANAPTNGFQSAMESVADIEHWMRTFAMNDLASFWDAFGNPNAKNTFLYKPERSGWKLMSWDFDVGLGVFNDPVNDPLFPTLNDTQMNRVYGNPAWVRLYWGAIAEGVNSFFQSGAGTAVDAILDAKFAAFQANGISLAAPAAIKSWITQRRNFLLTQLNTVSNVFNVSTNLISTTRNLITLAGTAPVSVRTITINGVEYTPTWLNATAWRITLPVAVGTNTLQIAGFDRFGNPVPNATRTVTVENSAAPELAADNIVINEVMYNPLVSDATYIELFNRSTTTSFDLSGWRLNGIDFTFPQGTILTNRALLVICKDRAAFGRAYGWGVPALQGYGGQLDDGGETLTLIQPGASPALDVVVDRVTYDDDPPWPAAPDGTGASLQLIDASQDNNRVSNWSDGSGWRFLSLTRSVGTAVATNLAFFFQAASQPGDIFLDDIALVEGSVAGAGQNVLQNGGFEEPFAPAWGVRGQATNTVITTAVAHSGAASAHVRFAGGSLGLTNFAQVFPALTTNTVYTLSFWYLSGSAGTNFAFRINTAFNGFIDPRSNPFSPGAPNAGTATLAPYPELWISEVQPNNVSTIADNAGDNDPWIEIHNSGATALSLDDYFLSDNYSGLIQWPFPAGTTINPGQYLLIWADNEPGEAAAGALHTNFRLNPTNGSIALSRTISGAPQIVDYFNYNDAITNRSYGTYPAGQSSYRQVFYLPTPGGTNDPSAPPITLFINEWMASNVSFLRDPFDQDFDDWFEIYNPTTNTVDLAGFSLTDDLARPRKAVLPAGISIAPLGYLLVWADEESSQTRTNGEPHVNFRLSSVAEQIALYDPSGRQIDSVTFSAQTNNISQGRFPNGGPGPFRYMATPTPRGPNIIPIVVAPVLRVTRGANDSVTLLWSTQSGSTYRIQYKDDLNAPDWTNLGASVTASGPVASVVDPSAGGQRFYRVVLE